MGRTSRTRLFGPCYCARVAGYERQVFVCVNERDPSNPRGCCKAKGAAAVRARLKSELAQRGLKGKVRANNSGCLDYCEHGVTMVVYPEQVWYGGVTVEDVDEIIERHVLGGEFVERLMLPDQAHLQGANRAAPLSIAAAVASTDGDPVAAPTTNDDAGDGA